GMSTEIVITHVASSTLAGQTQRFRKDRVRIGRRPDNDVALDPERDRKASSYHAEVFAERGGLYVKDSGSQNGTYVNGSKIAGPTSVGPADVIRLGESGPEMRAELARAGASEATANEPSPAAIRGAGTGAGPGGKQGIGQQTLARAIDAATVAERGRSRRALFATLGVVDVLLAGGGVWVSLRTQDVEKTRAEAERLAREQEAIKADVADARKSADALRAETKEHLDATMKSQAAEIAALEGKIGGSEARVARLIVEIQERDRALEEIRQKQNISEDEREAMRAETEKTLQGLRDELKKSEEEVRKAAGASNAADWADLVEKYKESIFLVVGQNPDGNTGIGTAFVVRGNGLLATNAHVAIMLQGMKVQVCIQNGTGRIFKVKRAKPHPDFKTPQSPDVALIEIDTEGAALAALPLATEADLRKLRIGTHLGTLGYPGELMDVYLSSVDQQNKRVKTAIATFKDGWIGRITNYQVEQCPFESSTLIQHSASLSGGTSGSPMFTADGKVIALNNAGLDNFVVTQAPEGGKDSKIVRTPSAAQIGFAIRVDELQRFMAATGW
ncbi:MAG TPA: trypsin-like peptidase domain-containing protein, partial [Planctomycetota bacterium]|nr:trypsin-like peptidase domain-containing protein [Planctomycetota bacterium]